MEVIIGKLAGFCPGVENTIKNAREILEKNKSERHIRGGEATRKKYLKKKKIYLLCLLVNIRSIVK